MQVQKKWHINNLKNEKNNLKSENNSASFVEVEKISNEDYPCRWRVCYYNNGSLIGCSAWTYGECLDTVVIKTK
ncbi:Hypothetical protein FBFL15_2030 [Flavobacterium branchiophilum FL-15]|uniref:Uncharacterized protein n=1 Tax=Flavobacterium branchiophilum (strain FL-15) TaxID=1034807 RepID=G2Z2A6_FLABF|nr:Hypothetical protein FBFL15_2030 [Flavobacterium branchiophilum FL-15]